jgi:hypothetical protein
MMNTKKGDAAKILAYSIQLKRLGLSSKILNAPFLAVISWHWHIWPNGKLEEFWNLSI